MGWYRRVFELPPQDAGKRLTLEFDGAYRETMVVFNNFYIGTHSGAWSRARSMYQTPPSLAAGTSRWCALTPPLATDGSTRAQACTAMFG